MSTDTNDTARLLADAEYVISLERACGMPPSELMNRLCAKVRELQAERDRLLPDAENWQLLSAVLTANDMDAQAGRTAAPVVTEEMMDAAWEAHDAQLAHAYPGTDPRMLTTSRAAMRAALTAALAKLSAADKTKRDMVVGTNLRRQSISFALMARAESPCNERQASLSPNLTACSFKATAQ